MINLHSPRLNSSMPKSKQSEKSEEKVLNVESKRSDKQNIASSENTDLQSLPLLENFQNADQQNPQSGVGAPTGRRKRKTHARKTPIIPTPTDLQQYFLPRKAFAKLLKSFARKKCGRINPAMHELFRSRLVEQTSEKL